MSLKRKVIYQFAKKQHANITKMAENAIDDQEAIFKSLLSKAKNTRFGIDHQFQSITSHAKYCIQVPIRSYEDIRSYIDLIIKGDKNVLWPGKPKYFAKTSGTTSGIKYIPISKESIKYHIKTARNAVLNYVAQTGKDIFSKKLIFLSGSPEMTKTGQIFTGRLSGIVNHEVPSWIRPNQLPSFTTNCFDDWEEKLEQVVKETIHEDMSLIGGIPPWVQMYYEKLIQRSSKKTIKDIFPNLQLFVHGGVNFLPYKAIMDSLHGTGVDSLETYPASEGFIAFQDNQEDDGLLLNTNAGMFFEFVKPEELSRENPKRCLLHEVKLDTDYAVLITSNAGLWAYNLGDTIRFTSLNPFKLRVSGRIKHYISAFGEHVISKEVEEAMDIVSNRHNLKITEFTVAPNINPDDGSTAHHEWFIEFESLPPKLDDIQRELDEEICRQNIYYKDLIEGNVLQKLRLSPLQNNAFRLYMKSLGKLGGQNKVPRLTNDRDIANAINKYKL